MDEDKYLEEHVNKILPKQKPLDNRSYFQRNKTLIIVVTTILVILFVGVNIYVRFSFNNIMQQLQTNP